MTNLGTLDEYSSGAYGINDTSQVVGVSGGQAFITGPNGVGMTDIGTLGGTYSRPTAINNGGQVAGYSRTEDGSTHTYITGPNGAGMTDIGTVGGFTGSVGPLALTIPVR
jgi:probable HAF family extracellular repeat protein